MKILHTSDWHLGRSLHGRKRYREFSAFLEWLVGTIEAQEIDVLLVAGDVFDTSTPSNRAQELYYRFLRRVSASCCRYVVIIAGNHDSPSFLNAPKELLRAFNVYVVGSKTDALDDEVIVLREDGQPRLIVCAVPYLRDKDIRTVEPGETIDDKNAKLLAGLRAHYAEVCQIAEQKRAAFEKAGSGAIPIIAMGHLFAADGKTVEGDGVRELYVGALSRVGAGDFPASIDYLALGHLHIPQSVGSADHMRYCGSPIPIGFGEATQQKKVILVEFTGTTPNMQEISVPCFQQLVRITGSMDVILARLEELKKEESGAWLDIEYTGSDAIGNLRERLDEAIAGSAMEIRRIKNQSAKDRVISTAEEAEMLHDLDVKEIFIRRLDASGVSEEEREELMASYDEIVRGINEEDANAE